jgi:hypothetical protein
MYGKESQAIGFLALSSQFPYSLPFIILKLRLSLLAIHPQNLLP